MNLCYSTTYLEPIPDKYFSLQKNNQQYKGCSEIFLAVMSLIIFVDISYLSAGENFWENAGALKEFFIQIRWFLQFKLGIVPLPSFHSRVCHCQPIPSQLLQSLLKIWLRYQINILWGGWGVIEKGNTFVPVLLPFRPCWKSGHLFQAVCWIWTWNHRKQVLISQIIHSMPGSCRYIRVKAWPKTDKSISMGVKADFMFFFVTKVFLFETLR